MRRTTPVRQLGDRKVIFLLVLFQVVKGDHRYELLVLLHYHHLVIALLRWLIFLETCSFAIATVLTGDLVKFVIASCHQPEHIDPFVVPASLLFPVLGRSALDSILE